MQNCAGPDIPENRRPLRITQSVRFESMNPHNGQFALVWEIVTLWRRSCYEQEADQGKGPKLFHYMAPFHCTRRMSCKPGGAPSG